MPIYEYKCAKCDGVFEIIQAFSDEPLKVHEGCGGEVRRLISAPALQFKGTGWYITDYAKGSGKSPASGGDNGKKSEGTKSEGTKSEGTKTESKPAATSGSSDKK